MLSIHSLQPALRAALAAERKTGFRHRNVSSSRGPLYKIDQLYARSYVQSFLLACCLSSPKKSVLLGRLRLRMSTVAPVQWLKRYPQLHIHLFQESCPFLMSDSNLNKLQNSLNYTSVDPKQFTVSKFRLKPVIVSVLDAATPTNTHPPHEGRQPETTTDSGRQDHFRAQEADHTNQHPPPT